MGIYIKDMEMPKECRTCPLNSAPPHGCLIWSINDIREGKRNESCPLIEIPTPHGRLIDADALDKELRRKWNYGDNGVTIANAPTILEAEE